MSNEHREKARKLVQEFQDHVISIDVIDALSVGAKRWLTERVASALSSRDAEVREALEGLATYQNPLCWCPPDTETEPHSEACRATTVLYTKLQPKEESKDVTNEIQP